MALYARLGRTCDVVVLATAYLPHRMMGEDGFKASAEQHLKWLPAVTANVEDLEVCVMILTSTLKVAVESKCPLKEVKEKSTP